MDKELENFDSLNEEQENLDSKIEEQDESDTETKEEYTEREKQYYARIKKLEDELKAKTTDTPKKKEPKQAEGLSTLDVLALSKANLEEEDIEEVMEWASFKKIPVREALKSTVLKATLAEKAEMRKSAEAVNTGSTRRPSGQTSDERLKADASKGILPDSDEEIARLARLRLQKRK